MLPQLSLVYLNVQQHFFIYQTIQAICNIVLMELILSSKYLLIIVPTEIKSKTKQSIFLRLNLQ
jgi:hypothetical protein